MRSSSTRCSRRRKPIKETSGRAAAAARSVQRGSDARPGVGEERGEGEKKKKVFFSERCSSSVCRSSTEPGSRRLASPRLRPPPLPKRAATIGGCKYLIGLRLAQGEGENIHGMAFDVIPVDENNQDYKPQRFFFFWTRGCVRCGDRDAPVGGGDEGNSVPARSRAPCGAQGLDDFNALWDAPILYPPPSVRLARVRSAPGTRSSHLYYLLCQSCAN